MVKVGLEVLRLPVVLVFKDLRENSFALSLDLSIILDVHATAMDTVELILYGIRSPRRPLRASRMSTLTTLGHRNP